MLVYNVLTFFVPLPLYVTVNTGNAAEQVQEDSGTRVPNTNLPEIDCTRQQARRESVFLHSWP